MTVIRPNSISGINSITANGGDINLFRADGTKADVPIVNNITAGIITATTFSGNLSGGTINATSGTITGNLGVGGVLTYEDVTNIDSVGVITARSGGYLDIRTGSSINTNATGSAASGTIHKNTNSGEFAVVSGGTGGNNHLTFYTSASAAPTEKLRIGPVGQLGIGGANYGLDGQVLTSKGPSAAIQWATVSTTPFGGALDGLNFGGTETTYTSGGTTYKVHSFTSSGVFRVTAAISVNFLIVGGGGGSSTAEGYQGATGGGGAGGMVEGTGITIPVGKHTVTVGSGGAAGGTYALAGNGGDSVFNYGTTITAKGGGGGSDYGTDGQDGGSGSGGAEPNRAAGASTQSSQNSGISGIAQFGNSGGAAAGYQSGAGGGGGAGSDGQARSAGGAGGSGRANSITGSSVTYAVGGNGGATGYVNGSPGTNGRGNGASGATSSHPNEGAGAAGGSGIIIIRYAFT